MKFLFLASAILPLYLSDTAADCHYEDIKGKWLFHYTDGGSDNSVNCNDPSLEFKHTVEISLDNINEVSRLDSFNSKGWFTLIYQQGFEIVLDQRKWFAYFWYNSEVNPWDYSAFKEFGHVGRAGKAIVKKRFFGRQFHHKTSKMTKLRRRTKLERTVRQPDS